MCCRPLIPRPSSASACALLGSRFLPLERPGSSRTQTRPHKPASWGSACFEGRGHPSIKPFPLKLPPFPEHPGVQALKTDTPASCGWTGALSLGLLRLGCPVSGSSCSFSGRGRRLDGVHLHQRKSLCRSLHLGHHREGGNYLQRAGTSLCKTEEGFSIKPGRALGPSRGTVTSDSCWIPGSAGLRVRGGR